MYALPRVWGKAGADLAPVVDDLGASPAPRGIPGKAQDILGMFEIARKKKYKPPPPPSGRGIPREGQRNRKKKRDAKEDTTGVRQQKAVGSSAFARCREQKQGGGRERGA